ncbi:MAG: hypothetical protein AAGB04_31780 [Pseudomonadota bacterium]
MTERMFSRLPCFTSERLRQITPVDDWPPTIIGSPEALCEKIRWAIDNPRERVAIGLSANSFVRSHWQAKDVAEWFLRLANGTAPAGWFIDPTKTKLWGGWGISLNDRDGMLADLLEKFGESWLSQADEVPIPLPR